MKRSPTYDDVNLILRLYELRREEKLRKARQWFMSSFKPKSPDDLNTLIPPGSEENAYFRMVVSYWEMAASFVTSGVLHEELFYQSQQELLFVWERVRHVVPQYREMRRNPIAYKNLETVARSFIQWWNEQAPEAHTQFQKMVNG